MSSRFIHEIAARKSIDATAGFDASFEARNIHELLVVFDAKHSGPAVCTLGNDAGASKEVHMLPAIGREGHFHADIGGADLWSRINVRLARGKSAKLEKIMLIGQPPTKPPA